jgi:outer membrane protein OmpA-like peptidoglycan-associated protein
MAAIAVAPVCFTVAATTENINCNEKSQLAYSSVDALHTTMKDDTDSKKLPDLSGQLAVEPKHTTTYAFQASGTGGLTKQQAAVNVNPVVQSTLEATPSEIHYVSVGNKVLVQDTADVKWTTTNADTMSLTPTGTVAANGQEKITANPKATTELVDETQSYTLTATNVCGGSDTKTVQVRTKGVIQPAVLSVFFPTGYPDRKHPDTGLVASQQERLMKLASIFPLYMEHAPDAKIVVRGYADPRGTDKYNMALSERRIAVVKAFLIAHSIPEDKIAIEPLGFTQALDATTVDQLEAENPFKPADTAKQQKPRTIRLAYDRRVDVELQPAAMQSSRFFPHPAAEAGLLLQPTWPSLHKVKEAQQAPTAAAAGAGTLP